EAGARGGGQDHQLASQYRAERSKRSTEMASIELVDLTKHYRQGKTVVSALDGVSLEIGAGEFVSVVGRSGSGKTTMLDLIGLLLRPTGGRVLIDGQDAALLKDNRRADVRGQRIGVIFQEFNLLPALNVMENVMLPLRYTKSNVKDAGRGRWSCWRRWAWRTEHGTVRTSCREGSSSGWRLPGRWSTGPPWCSATSRRGRWTRRLHRSW